MCSAQNKNAPFATLFSSDAFNIKGERIMGRQAAGNSYLKALFHEKYDNLALYINNIADDPRNERNSRLIGEFLNEFSGKENKTKVQLLPYDQPVLSNAYGGIFRPDPNIIPLAKQRSYFGHDSYSLVGITHTTASHSIMSSIAELVTAPILPWDAIICTSQAVKDTVDVIHDHYFDYLQYRFGATRRPTFQLPIIPLGVNNDEFDNKRNRSGIRKSFGINDNDIAVIFVGRISFHAKAHNLPMFLALESVAKDFPDKKIHFLMAGWFPNDTYEKFYKEDAKKFCPSINVIFVDGRDQGKKIDVFSSGDIFFSLTDNIQETFGLTPLEGMASGLPVLVSDWNGYRDTVRDGVDGFRIKTTSFPEELSKLLAHRHDIGMDTYDRYCGYHSQFTSVDLRETVEKFKLLVSDKDLRIKLGNNGKKHAKEKFDWSVILKSYNELESELTDIKTSGEKFEKTYLSILPPDRLEPFKIFNSYPTEKIHQKTRIRKIEGINPFPISEIRQTESINFAHSVLPHEEDIDNVLSVLKIDKDITIKNLLSETGISKSEIYKAITWLLKFGYIEVKG